MTHQSQLEKNKYRNWVRAGLGLLYVKEGLEPFCDDVVKQQHTDIINRVKQTQAVPTVTCRQCNLRTLKPNHVRDPNRQCPLGQANCNCQHPGGKIACPNRVCGAIYDEIIKLHASKPPAPFWKNTDSRLWCTDPWSIARCFINAPGYADKLTVSSTDCSGILHVLINNKGLHKHIQCLITLAGTDVFSEVRKDRNSILHSNNMELEDNDVNKIIDNMVVVLQDGKELNARTESQAAIKKLLELKNEDFIITTQREAQVLNGIVQAITLKEKEIIQNIDSKFNELKLMEMEIKRDIHTKGDEVKDTLDKRETEMKRNLEEQYTKAHGNLQKKSVEAAEQLEQRIEEFEKRMSASLAEINESVANRTKNDETLSRRIDILEEQMSEQRKQSEELLNCRKELEAKKLLTEKRLDYIKKKDDYQTRLVNLYEENVVQVPILPLQPGTHMEDIDTVYFEPWLGVETRQSEEGSSQSRKSTKTEMSMHEIFSNKGKRVRLIYILGEAGSGKSTLCIYLVRQWCTAHASSKVSNAIESESDSEIVKAMKSFDFLFYITLRHNADCYKIKQMLDQQYGDTILDKMLESESSKCLILLDGLDEWTQDKQVSQFQSKGIPTRDHNKEYTIITTTRPWKFETLGINDKEVHKKIRLKGLDQQGLDGMTKQFIDMLNQKDQTKNKDMCEFEVMIKKSPVFKMRHMPLILRQFICLWFDDKLHKTSVCVNYSRMLELFFDWAELKDDRLSSMQNLTQNKENIHLPDYLSSSDTCSKFRYIIRCLAQLAFETLFRVNKENSLSFTDTIFTDLKIPKEVKTCSLKTGILCEDQFVTLSVSSRQKSIFSFAHKTIQEYLAAVHVAIEFENLSEMECQEKCKQCVEKYLSTCKTVADILQQSIVIIMLCGLQPELVTAISKYIYNITTSDKTYQEQNIFCPHPVFSVEKCIVRCIEEVRANGKHLQENIFLSEISIDSEHKARLCEQTIDPQSVQHLRYGIPLTESFIQILPQMNQLISLIFLKRLQMSGEYCSTFTAFLEQSTQLKHISVKIKCSDHDKHTLDLSQHEQIESILLKVCDLPVSCDCMSSAVKTSPEELKVMEVCISGVYSKVKCLPISSHALEFQYPNKTKSKTNHLLMKFPAVMNIDTLDLLSLTLSDPVFAHPSDMTSLKQIILHSVTMNITTWKMFIDILPTMPNSVEVNTIMLMIRKYREKNMSYENIDNTTVNDKTEESVASFPVNEANDVLTVNEANKNLSVTGDIDDLNINEASDKLKDGRSNDELTKSSTASEDCSSDDTSDHDWLSDSEESDDDRDFTSDDSSHFDWLAASDDSDDDWDFSSDDSSDHALPLIHKAKKYVKEKKELFSVVLDDELEEKFNFICKGKSRSILSDSESSEECSM